MKKICLLVLILIGISNGTAFAQLPQEHDYQITLRNYLKQFREKDFEVELKPIEVKRSYFSSAEDAYRTWLFFGYEQNEFMESEGLRVDGSYFTLDNIEANGQVNMTVGKSRFMLAIPTAFYAAWNYKGNPYYNSRAVKLRAFVASAVDMMMQDQQLERGKNDRSDFVGLQLIRWAYPYGVIKDDLPQKVRNAYEKGLIKMFERLEKWGTTGIHADMDMGALVGMLYTAKFADSQDLQRRAERHVDMILKKHLKAPGYIDHGSAYDAGYNGISAYFINWAAQLSKYQPLIEAVKKMSRLKAYMTLPDPDGREFSPFHSNPSSGGDAPHDYWSSYNREVGMARFSDDAVYLALGGGDRSVKSLNEMGVDMEKMLRFLNHPNSGKFLEPSNKKPGKWKHEHWIDGQSLDATAMYMQDDLYPRLKSLQQSNSKFMKPPFSRNEDFTESLGDKFLSVKRKSYGTIIFNDRLSWWTSKGQTETINGFGGGNLSAFWTPSTGTVLLSGTKTAHGGGLDLKDWRMWPVHAVSGETSGGRAFSSGIQRNPKSNYELNRKYPRVTISGDLTDIYADPTDALQGKAEYNRIFNIKDNGIEVNTSINGDGSNKIKSLYEILPVYLRHGRMQKNERPTEIAFEVNGRWQKAGTNLKTVSRIRLKRFGGAVFIDFENPRQVKLSDKTFYQAKNSTKGMNARNIMIKMGDSSRLGNSSVRYFIRSSEASPNNSWNDTEDDANKGKGDNSGDDGTDDGNSDNKEKDKNTDNTPPKLKISHSPAKPDDTQRVTFTATARDSSDIKKITIFLDGKTVTTCTAKNTCKLQTDPFKPGKHNYSAKAIDNSKQANKVASGSKSFRVTASSDSDDKDKHDGSDEDDKPKDTTPPEVKVSHVPSKPDDTQKVTFTASASDDSNIKKIFIFLDGKTVKTCTGKNTCKLVTDPFKPGSHKYSAKAIDNAKQSNGATSGSTSFKVTASNNSDDDEKDEDPDEAPKDTTPPEVKITHVPSKPDDTQPVTFTASASDDSDIKKIAIIMDGQMVKTCKGTTTCKLKTDPFKPGRYDYSAKAQDNSGNGNSTETSKKSFRVTPAPPENTPPVKVKVKLKRGERYLTAEVENVSDPDGDEVNLVYDWRINSESIAVVNIPFDVNFSNKSDETQTVHNYTSFQNIVSNKDAAKLPKWNEGGRRGGASLFDGKKDYMRVSKAEKNKGRKLKKFSVEAWVKHDGWGEEWASVISKPYYKSSWKKPWVVFKLSRYKDKDNINFQITTGDKEVHDIQTKQSLPSDEWAHILGTYDGKKLKIYVNGILDNEETVNRPLADNSETDIYIGKSTGAGGISQHYKGLLDEVRVLNVAISADQVKQHYKMNYNKMALDNMKSGQEWGVSVSANDAKTVSEAGTINAIMLRAEDLPNAGEALESTLVQNFPNPFRSSTTIPYSLKDEQDIEIKIYDSSGRLVDTVYKGSASAGEDSKRFSPSQLSSGVYFYQLVTKDKTITKKMTFLK